MRNALYGYSYQQYVAYLFLVIMDVERNIDQMVLEADVNHMFDDVALTIGPQRYYLQIKDFDKIMIQSLTINDGNININGKPHRLSDDINVIFFKQIDFVPNAEVLGFPAYESSGVYFVSLRRAAIGNLVDKLYNNNLQRKARIDQFFDIQLDERLLVFEKHLLPPILVYDTRLTERTVKVSRNLLEVTDILFIEGKPGIGKSHLVDVLQDQFNNHLLYRFWVSTQDSDHVDRLKYVNFLSDLSKHLFYDYKERDEAEILAKLAIAERVLVVDGLDHVENYNSKDLAKFISFLDRAKASCKVIVLSRPLVAQIIWQKQTLTNWNEQETRQVLDELYVINDFIISGKIYDITGGYPILVSYVAQQFRQDGILNESQRFDSINSYYDNLLREENGKRALALFLCSRSYFMRSEFKFFLNDLLLGIVEEFIAEHPFLFEVRLNRISLFHDSLITYLHQSGISYQALRDKVNEVVSRSLLNVERRFQSRLGSFKFSNDQAVTIIKFFASIHNFKKIMAGVIDFDAIRELYSHVREQLSLLNPGDLEVTEYYDLALIVNMVMRDHISHTRDFQYTFIQALWSESYSDEEVTSNGYFFSIWYYLKTNDASLLLNKMSDDRYDTNNFYGQLENDIREEKDFFKFQDRAFDPYKIQKAIKDTDAFKYRDNLEDILSNLYLYEDNRVRFPKLFEAITQYVAGNEDLGIKTLVKALNTRFVERWQAAYILANSKKDLLARGADPEKNDYLLLSLKAYLDKYGNIGSFDLWPAVHAYLRLALHFGQKIDISSISKFWIKYHQRRDYSLSAIDQALTVFEQKKWINWQASVKLITEIQSFSEKGYRGLLASYIMAHEPAFISTLLDEFNFDQLRIEWFHLDPSYLDVIPESIYRLQRHQLFGYHRDQKIPATDIINLLSSNKSIMIKGDMEMFGYCAVVEEGDKLIGELERFEIPYNTYIRDKSYTSDDDLEKQFNQGILDKKNAGLIKVKKLSPGVVASMSDGYYTALAEPALFQHFSKARVQRDFREILFCSLTAKSKLSNYHHAPWNFPGNILRIMADNDIDIPKVIFISFTEYLRMSLIDFDPKAQ
jgi:hypothetical protein